MKCFTVIIVLVISIVFAFSSLIAQTDWTIYPNNPILSRGGGESWEYTLEWPYVFHDGDQFVMYYGGGPDATGVIEAIEIGRATSEDGYIWTKYEENPVLSYGPEGSWDEEWAEPGPVIYDGEEYKMWYIGFNGSSWRIGLATSADGIDWLKHESNPVVDLGDTDQWDDRNVRVGNVIYDQSQYKMWYTGSDGDHWRVGYATSPDGVNWTKYNENPVLDIGESGTWDDERIDHCYVIKNGEMYEMWYQGYDEPLFDYFPTGYATSADGISWERFEENPILGSSVSSVLYDGNIYRMWTWVLGYAEDFSHIAHSDSLAFSSYYARPLRDTLWISAWVENPQEQSITVEAIIADEDSTLVDSISLSDQGEGLWKGWIVPEEERICQVWIETLDEASETMHNGMLWNIDYFSTSGPVKLNHIETISEDVIANAGETLQYRSYMRNNGHTTTVEDVSIKFTELDSLTTVIAFEDPRYGDIAPGEVADPHRGFRIYFHDDIQEPINSWFKVDVLTGTHIFWSDTFAVLDGRVTDIAEQDPTYIRIFSLKQNYPNPFNPRTIINYELPITNDVDLSIYNLLGEKVATLVSKRQNAGYHTVEWDASGFASGVYYYRIEAGEFVEVKKMVLLR